MKKHYVKKENVKNTKQIICKKNKYIYFNLIKNLCKQLCKEL